MNYRQVYKRYDLKPVDLGHSAVQGRSGRKAFGVYKNMQSSGWGPGGDYYLQRYQPFLGEAKSAEFGTYSSPQFRPKNAPAPPDQSYSQPPTRYDPSIEAKAAQSHNSAPADSAYDDKLAELQTLQEQLRKREEELAKYQRLKQSVSHSPAKSPFPSDAEAFDRINKSLWDKQVFAEHRKANVQALNYQLNEKEMKQQWVTLQREQEQMQRLEHLKRLREVEMQERLNLLSRAQQYRQHLDMQQELKQQLAVQERLRNQALPPAETAPPRQSPMHTNYEPQTEYEKVAMQFYELPTDSLTASSLTPFRLTKKSPKTISYNPITGIVRDTSLYLQGNIPRPVLKSYLPEPRNQDRVVPAYSHLPAFQQPMYTAKNPMVVSTDPISMKLPKKDFKTREYYQDAAKFFGVDEEQPSGSQLSEYGAMVLQPAGLSKGYSYKDTRQQ